MKRAALFLLAVSLTLATSSPAAKGPDGFLAREAIDVKAVLPAPPPIGSLAALGDLEAVRQAQVMRTPQDVAWAVLIEDDTVFNNASVLGPWFAADKLPHTAGFFARVTADVLSVSYRAKDLFLRPRPPKVDPALHPCVHLSESGSYPSRHSTQAFVWAYVLGEIFPEHQAELIERAHRAAWGRVLGGVHYPTDLIGGKILADAIIAELRKLPEYRAAVEKCRQEAAPYLLKEAA
ncbi:MAG TPA: phosphatase PAP2 family protein [Opitutaceae bacterium]|nr:phosphatase PAP2 family protein [Opitutaceae bacterium]HND59828.1 phosphatase PAP2 family protein [Opitutaceae bacterium]